MDATRDETRFFGRAAEIAEVEARLARGARIVAIVGLAGTGKSRLAAVVANAKNATFVALGDTRTLDAAVHEIASRTGVKTGDAKADEATKALGRALGARIVVLDGLETLGAAAKTLVEGLVAGATDLVVLTTSRAPVGARGEEKIVLSSLGEDDAVALLRDRARLAAGKSIDVADDVARAVVRRLDRLPLAIELAAARLEVLSPTELRTRLEQGATTMVAALDASWEMLDEAERSALAQCAVFAAPFGVDAAEEVVVVKGRETLDVLESLLRKCLLARAEGDGPARLRTYETVRTWARTKIDDDVVRVRHAQFHVEEAELWASRAYGPRAEHAFDVLSELLPELLVVVDGFEEKTPAIAARAALALMDLLRFRGFFELRGDLFARGVESAERAKDDVLLARALVAKARVTLEESRVADAEKELRRAVELSSDAKDAATEAEARRSLGWALIAMNRLDEAEKELERAHLVHREQGSARGEADARVALGLVRAFQGRSEESLGCLRDALAIHVEHGDVIRQEKVLGFAALAGHAAVDVARGLPRDVLARAPEESLSVVPGAVRDVVEAQAAHKAGWVEALAHYRAGAAAADPRAALASFEAALAVLGKLGIARGASAIRAHAAVALAETGDLMEADAWIERAHRDAKDVPGGALVVDVFAAAVGAIRGDTKSARDVLDRARRADASTPELAAALALLERVLRAPRDAGPASIAAPVLEVAAEARSFVAGGTRVDLGRYGPVRKLLDALVEARLSRPGEALSAEALIEAGWPGERMRHTAGLLRVYSAVRRLRRLGLESILVTRDDGYLLDPNAHVRRAA